MKHTWDEHLDEEVPVATYGVHREDEDAPALSVTREDVLASIDRALAESLQGLVEPVDRDLSLYFATNAAPE